MTPAEVERLDRDPVEPQAYQEELIAEQDVLVDVGHGYKAQVFAGLPVPPALQPGYREAVGLEPSTKLPGAPASGAEFASDAAAKAAQEAGLSAEEIGQGSGKGGKITVKDVRAAKE